MLSLLIFLPLMAALLAFILPKHLARPWAFAFSLVNLVLVGLIWSDFDPNFIGLQYFESCSWIPQLGLTYTLGVDGISLPLIALTAFVAPIAILGTWPKGELPHHENFFVANVLALQTGMYGTFLSQDLFLFYVFWEVVLIPMFFLIGLWGGQNRIYATVK